mmetsp:Transcript_10701/g.23344  ORF Transcript_10701/g.23344 Transcript_10701/m.23344 type:complete len:146 (-) Transcript_10701:28-465(-)
MQGESGDLHNPLTTTMDRQIMRCRWGQYQFDGGKRVGQVADLMFPAFNLGFGCATFECERECSNVTLQVLCEMVILSKPFALVVVTQLACFQHVDQTQIKPGAYQLFVFFARIHLDRQRARLISPATLNGGHTIDSMNEYILTKV